MKWRAELRDAAHRESVQPIGNAPGQGRSVPNVHGAGAGSLSRGLVLAPFQYARFVDEFLLVHGEAGHVGGVSDLVFGLV